MNKLLELKAANERLENYARSLEYHISQLVALPGGRRSLGYMLESQRELETSLEEKSEELRSAMVELEERSGELKEKRVEIEELKDAGVREQRRVYEELEAAKKGYQKSYECEMNRLREEYRRRLEVDKQEIMREFDRLRCHLESEYDSRRVREKNDIDQLKKKLDGEREDLRQLKTEYETRKKELESTTNRRIEQIQLQAEESRLQAEEDLINMKLDHRKEIDDVRDNYDKLIAKMNETSNSTVAQLTSEITLLNKQGMTLTENLSRQVDILNHEKEHLNQELQSLNEKHNIFIKTLNQTQVKQLQTLYELSRTKSEIEYWKTQHEYETSNVKRLNNNLQSIEHKYESLRSSTLPELQQQLENISEINNVLKHKNLELQKYNELYIATLKPAITIALCQRADTINKPIKKLIDNITTPIGQRLVHHSPK
ncbi:putative viral A-type inclusion protein [Gregarina niphandrodes]|uniref:Viral A-type inclusion protein n=1 Tax=Gregarina niphandrodes TaxID=110365 RepID=A0A023B9V7_GRENI|nr:putative viral A-type inclusion protein [Gregarina niphandrodes]EZG76058.1 putative viral A-type inclusion protein [Gregarina niphandrodes]|eukprot:XP_011129592.1 putative viral A-type inclusion protein [Gregarina niphandrodes]